MLRKFVINTLITILQSVYLALNRSVYFWHTPAGNSKDNNDVTVKDGTSVLNQGEQAVSQPVRSYPLVPGSRKQDFAVDSHYQLHFTYSSPGADRLRFICLISYSLRSCFDFANSFVTCQNDFPECKICRKSALMHLVARSIQCIGALPTYFIDRNFKDWIYRQESVRFSQIAITLWECAMCS